MTTQVNWREARPADAARIAELETQLFGDTAWSEALVTDELTGPYRKYTALEQDGDIVGYGGVLVVAGDGDIQTIALTEAVRGQGLGRELLTKLCTDARAMGARQVFLEVRADNTVALGLYQRSGFETIGERVGYYQPGNVDAIIMRKPLTGESQKDER